MKTIYLVRHCKAYGQASSAKLTDEGKQQAENLAEFFADRNIQYILSSPYHRAIATIKPLAEKLRLTIHLDERLRERILSTIDVPDWIEKLKVSFTDMDLRFAGGESSREAMDRGVSVINEVMKRPEKS
mgnify:CR=1 FL=1